MFYRVLNMLASSESSVETVMKEMAWRGFKEVDSMSTLRDEMIGVYNDIEIRKQRLPMPTISHMKKTSSNEALFVYAMQSETVRLSSRSAWPSTLHVTIVRPSEDDASQRRCDEVLVALPHKATKDSLASVMTDISAIMAGQTVEAPECCVCMSALNASYCIATCKSCHAALHKDCWEDCVRNSVGSKCPSCRQLFV
jgi:hypothetical protein